MLSFLVPKLRSLWNAIRAAIRVAIRCFAKFVFFLFASLHIPLPSCVFSISISAWANFAKRALISCCFFLSSIFSLILNIHICKSLALDILEHYGRCEMMQWIRKDKIPFWCISSWNICLFKLHDQNSASIARVGMNVTLIEKLEKMGCENTDGKHIYSASSCVAIRSTPDVTSVLCSFYTDFYVHFLLISPISPQDH